MSLAENVCVVTAGLLDALSIDSKTVTDLEEQAVATVGLSGILIATGALLLFGPAIFGKGSIVKTVNFLAAIAALILGAWGCKLAGIPGVLAAKFGIDPAFECAGTLVVLLILALSMSLSGLIAIAFFAIGAAAGGLLGWLAAGMLVTVPQLAEVPEPQVALVTVVVCALAGGVAVCKAQEDLLSLVATLVGALLTAMGLTAAFGASGLELVDELRFQAYYPYYLAGTAVLLVLFRTTMCQETKTYEKPVVMR